MKCNLISNFLFRSMRAPATVHIFVRTLDITRKCRLSVFWIYSWSLLFYRFSLYLQTVSTQKRFCCFENSSLFVFFQFFQNNILMVSGYFKMSTAVTITAPSVKHILLDSLVVMKIVKHVDSELHAGISEVFAFLSHSLKVFTGFRRRLRRSSHWTRVP